MGGGGVEKSKIMLAFFNKKRRKRNVSQLIEELEMFISVRRNNRKFEKRNLKANMILLGFKIFLGIATQCLLAYLFPSTIRFHILYLDGKQ